MSKFIFLLLGFFVAGCQANETLINPIELDLEKISFDVVQKQLVTETELPQHVHDILSKWFNEKVKIDGFDGEMKFTISNYSQEISSISDGKRVDVSLSFNVNLPSIHFEQVGKADGSFPKISISNGL